MTIRVCVAGVTGWTGGKVAEALLESDEFELVSGVSRRAAGQSVASAIGVPVTSSAFVVGSVKEALSADPDVLIDYTHPNAVKSHTLAAISAGTAVVIGTSGLGSADFDEIGRAAESGGVGVVAAGNFSVTAALLKHFAGIAARHVPHWEIVDMASANKPDAPSGTARELADFLGDVARNELALPVADTLGAKDARGTSIGGAQVHSVRLPSYVLSVEATFGLPHERLTIRHDAGSGAEPYVAGTLLAARAAPTLDGLIRGLDTLLFSGDGGASAEPG